MRRRFPALFSYGGASDEGLAEFRRKYPDCPIVQPLDCLSLPLKREFAEDIVSGRKTVEYREFKSHYHKRLLDKEALKWVNEHNAMLTDDEIMYANPIRPVRRIHFYDYNGTWSLDVSIKETGTFSFKASDIRHQHELGSHDYDEDYEEFQARGVPESQRPILYYFAIDRIISSNL